MRHTDSPSPGTTPGQGPPLHNPDVAHEHSDINVRALVRFTVALFIVTVIVHILMWGMFRLLESRAAQNDAPFSQVARPATEMPANTVANPVFGPKQATPLLTNEPTVLRQYRAQEAEALGNYGWVDEKGGVARIPIEEAKKLILQRGLPARAEGAADVQLGTRMGAYLESYGGRMPTRAAAQPEGSTPPQAPAPDGQPVAAPPTGH